MKQLEDGSMAVGLFNKTVAPRDVTIKLRQLGFYTKRTVRDLWRQKDLTTTDDEFTATVNPHGAVMLRIY